MPKYERRRLVPCRVDRDEVSSSCQFAHAQFLNYGWNGHVGLECAWAWNG
jgi:hypothetical protein